MRPANAVIRHKTIELDDTVTLELELLDADWPGFAPGQFNMLYAFGTGEAAISISGDPAKPGRITHTIRRAGSTSAALTALKTGQHLGLRGPFGSAWPAAAAKNKHAIVIAGGLGLAPLRPLLYRLMHEAGACARLTLIYGARTPDAILFARELQRWQDAGAISVLRTVDQADQSWRGHVGVVTDRLVETEIEPDNTVAYLCGPEVMMRFGARALMERGIAPEDIYVSMERNMKCALGFCGHCQLGPHFICKDGPVFAYPEMARAFDMRQL